MPKKIGSSGSSHTHLPVNIAQSDNPLTPLPAEQGSASTVSGQSSSQARKAEGRGAAEQLRKQLQEANNRVEGEKWCRRLIKEISVPLQSLEMDLEKCLKPLLRDSFVHAKKQHNALLKTDPNNNEEQALKQNMQQFNLMQEVLDKTISAFDEKMAAVFSKAVATLQEFDSLPPTTKRNLCDAEKRLEPFWNKCKAAFIKCKESRIDASRRKADIQTLHAFGKQHLLRAKQVSLLNQMSQGDYSDSVRRGVEEMLDEYDSLSTDLMTFAAEDSEDIEAWGKLLADPYLPDTNEKEAGKNRIKRARQVAQGERSESFLRLMINPEQKLRMLMPLIRHDNKRQQGNESLWKCLELTESLLDKEQSSAWMVSDHLIKEEVLNPVNVGKLSRDELSMRLEAAREESDRFEKIIRMCKKRTEEYENLEGVAKDDRLTSVLEELTATIGEFIQARKYVVQFWVGKIQELKDQESSFLPPGVQAGPSRQQIFYKTKEGVVVGQINQNKLECLDDRGRTIYTCFQDKDSQSWVRDYGDEPELAPPAPSSISAAADGQTAIREKADQRIRKAGNIAEASTRFTEKARARIAASGDYDDQLHWLHRAFSEKAKAIAKVLTHLGEVEKIAAADLCAPLKGDLKRLREEKNDLDRQLQQTQQAHHIHLRKRQDPTEARFKFLWEQKQVAFIEKEFDRRESRNNAGDWLERYVISFQGAQGEEYDPWIVHAHYDSDAADAGPARVHMKRDAEKNWGAELNPYHSPPLSEDIFDLVKREAALNTLP